MYIEDLEEQVDVVTLQCLRNGRKGVDTTSKITALFVSILRDNGVEINNRPLVVDEELDICLAMVNDVFKTEQLPILLKDLKGIRKFKEITSVRNYVFLCLSELYGRSHKDIASSVNKIDRSTVSSQIFTVKEEARFSKKEKRRLATLRRRINLIKKENENVKND